MGIEVIRNRAVFARSHGERIKNAGIVDAADRVEAMLRRKATAGEILRSEAYRVVLRVWYR